MTDGFDGLHQARDVAGVRWLYGEYSREDLANMDLVSLRALLRERVHHTIEVEIYPVLLGDKQAHPKMGSQARMVWEVALERGLSPDDPDLQWCRQYLDLAQKVAAGEKVEISEPLPEPFSPQEMAVVKKLMLQRRSVRDWVPDKTVPDELIEQILEAGRAAPNSCNLCTVRFVVIKDPKKQKMVWSDIPTPADRCTLIVICYDKRAYQVVGHDRLVPHNMLLDCAAAGDHMCLMAHALGLGAVWLTCTEKTARTFKKKFNLPDYIEQALHLAVGYTAMPSIKSQRMPLREMILQEGGQDV